MFYSIFLSKYEVVFISSYNVRDNGSERMKRGAVHRVISSVRVVSTLCASKLWFYIREDKGYYFSNIRLSSDLF
jgi:hypothetical protein